MEVNHEQLSMFLSPTSVLVLPNSRWRRRYAQVRVRGGGRGYAQVRVWSGGGRRCGSSRAPSARDDVVG